MGEEVGTCFDLSDTNQDGKLTQGEFKHAVRALCKIGGFPTSAQLDLLLDDKEFVDKATFTAIMEKRIETFEAEGGMEAFFKNNSNPFKVIDEENKGFITGEKLMNIMTGMGDHLDHAQFSKLFAVL